MFRRIAPALFVGLIAQALVACGSTPTPSAGSRQVDEPAIARELASELPGLEQSTAFRLQVSDIADLCRSSAEDFAIVARSVATADLQRQLHRQMSAGCPWRLHELDKLLARQVRTNKR